MKYFLDTEFIEYPNTIHLISIGIVAEDGLEFYAENKDIDWDLASDWVKKNVRPNLKGGNSILSLENIKIKILEFIGNDTPEFWGYYCSFDWVIFCWIFGPMINLPNGWSKFCNDLQQLCLNKGNPCLPKQISNRHNSLDDARWNFDIYKFLIL